MNKHIPDVSVTAEGQISVKSEDIIASPEGQRQLQSLREILLSKNVQEWVREKRRIYNSEAEAH